MRVIVYLLSVAVLFALADPVLAQTRYSSIEAPRAPTPSTAPTAPKLRMLTWPGKVQPASPTTTAVARVAPLARIAPVRAGPAAAPARAVPAVPAAPTRAALPTSIYDAPPPPAPKAQALASAWPTAKTYSLHRQYGETPDPVALTPRFFDEASPDLADPPPPAPRSFTTTGGRVVRAAPASAAPE